MIAGILNLPENGGHDFTPGGEKARIGRRTIVFHRGMQLRQRVIRHQGEHMVLDVVVHVPVQIPVDPAHVHRAAVEPVIEHILGQTRVLRVPVSDQQPGAEDSSTSMPPRHAQRQIQRTAAHRAMCSFEFIYFARPDSVMMGKSLYKSRRQMGRELAREAPADGDIVITLPDSGTPAAIGYAEQAGLPFAEGMIKSRYITRTFIQPTQRLREAGIRLKFNPMRHVLEGRRVVLA